MITKDQFKAYSLWTVIAGCVLFLLILALCSCATTRPDPGKYLTPTDHGTYTFDEHAYGVALADSRRHDWACVLADTGTTLAGVAIGLSESNPLGLIVIPVALINHMAVAKQRDAGNDAPQRVENAVHCGAAALNVAVIAGAL